VEDQPAERPPSSPDAMDWLPPEGGDALRALVTRYLRGERRLNADIEQLAADLARRARAQGETPERLLIGIRSLWRDLGLSQSDRLQAASLYEQLVRQVIEKYYG
jgi:hypothetical protein